MRAILRCTPGICQAYSYRLDDSMRLSGMQIGVLARSADASTGALVPVPYPSLAPWNCGRAPVPDLSADPWNCGQAPAPDSAPLGDVPVPVPALGPSAVAPSV